jgi:hypothetical protein
MDQAAAAFTSCVMQGVTPTAFIMGEDDWRRWESESVRGGMTLLQGAALAVGNRIMDCTILISPKVGGITAVADDVRHSLQQTGLFRVLF